MVTAARLGRWGMPPCTSCASSRHTVFTSAPIAAGQLRAFALTESEAAAAHRERRAIGPATCRIEFGAEHIFERLADVSA